MDLKNRELLRKGDRVWAWTADTPLKQKYVDQPGTILIGGKGCDLATVELDDGHVISLYAHRFHKRPKVLQYDPNQQGDTDEDI